MLHNKKALITGSTSGIGLGIAHKLADAGAEVVIHGFADKNIIESIKKEFAKKYGKDIAYFDSDLTDYKAIEKMFDEMKDVDILVNNAGMQFVAPVDEFPPEKWNQIIALNLTASFHTIRLSIPSMEKKKWGRIINIDSAHGIVASPFKSAYVASKHGLIGLTKTTALEVAENGITVNAVCPGYVETPLVLGQIAATAKARGISEKDVIDTVMLKPHATHKFIQIDEVASLVLFLCQDSAKSITGASIAIDAGWTAQ